MSDVSVDFRPPYWCPPEWVPTWFLHTKLSLISILGKPFVRISHMKNCTDLNLGEDFFFLISQILNSIFKTVLIWNGVTVKTSNRMRQSLICAVGVDESLRVYNIIFCYYLFKIFQSSLKTPLPPRRLPTEHFQFLGTVSKCEQMFSPCRYSTKSRSDIRRLRRASFRYFCFVLG